MANMWPYANMWDRFVRESETLTQHGNPIAVLRDSRHVSPKAASAVRSKALGRGRRACEHLRARVEKGCELVESLRLVVKVDDILDDIGVGLPVELLQIIGREDKNIAVTCRGSARMHGAKHTGVKVKLTADALRYPAGT